MTVTLLLHSADRYCNSCMPVKTGENSIIRLKTSQPVISDPEKTLVSVQTLQTSDQLSVRPLQTSRAPLEATALCGEVACTVWCTTEA